MVGAKYKISKNEAINFAEGLYLTGVCRCGKHFNVYAEMPEHIMVSSGGEVFRAKPAEHLIIICPYCNRLVNCGNGTRRKNKREA